MVKYLGYFRLDWGQEETLAKPIIRFLTQSLLPE